MKGRIPKERAENGCRVSKVSIWHGNQKKTALPERNPTRCGKNALKNPVVVKFTGPVTEIQVPKAINFYYWNAFQIDCSDESVLNTSIIFIANFRRVYFYRRIFLNNNSN